MSDGKVKSGVQFDPNGTLSLKFTERVYDYHGAGSVASPRVTGQENVEGVEQTPIDEAAAKVIQYDMVAIAAAFENEWIISAGKITLTYLPDELNSISISFNKTVGLGATHFPASQAGFHIDVRGSGSINPRATAEGSAAILPSVAWDISIHRDKLVNCIHYYFYLTQESNIAGVLAKLTAKIGTAVFDMPVFGPKPVQLKVLGQQVSVQASASSEAGLAFTEDPGPVVTSETTSFSWGNGFSRQVGATEKVETIPPTVHTNISLTDNEDTQDVSAEVSANTVDLSIDGVPQVDAITNEPAAVEATATGTVLAFDGSTNIGSTSPSSIPKTNLYLAQLDSESDERFGFTKIHAAVVNMAQYA